MTTKSTLATLLAANPRAKRDWKTLKRAIADVHELHASGVGGRGYSLSRPFGEKANARPKEPSARRKRIPRSRMTIDA